MGIGLLMYCLDWNLFVPLQLGACFNVGEAYTDQLRFHPQDHMNYDVALMLLPTPSNMPVMKLVGAISEGWHCWLTDLLNGWLLPNGWLLQQIVVWAGWVWWFPTSTKTRQNCCRQTCPACA